MPNPNVFKVADVFNVANVLSFADIFDGANSFNTADVFNVANVPNVRNILNVRNLLEFHIVLAINVVCVTASQVAQNKTYALYEHLVQICALDSWRQSSLEYKDERFQERIGGLWKDIYLAT